MCVALQYQIFSSSIDRQQSIAFRIFHSFIKLYTNIPPSSIKSCLLTLTQMRSSPTTCQPLSCPYLNLLLSHTNSLTLITTTPSTYSTPPISRIPKRPQQHRHMIMFPLLIPPNQKLNLHLRKECLHPPLPKIILRIERQTIHLVPILLEQRLEIRGRSKGRGGRRCPAGYAAVGVGCGGEG